ncbi:hypothetical protein KR215_000341 [Drosophila sulfurigaster]|nr:hypothetical protein KR215_000341 [Drosophila sulfurigaster]
MTPLWILMLFLASTQAAFNSGVANILNEIYDTFKKYQEEYDIEDSVLNQYVPPPPPPSPSNPSPIPYPLFDDSRVQTLEANYRNRLPHGPFQGPIGYYY